MENLDYQAMYEDLYSDVSQAIVFLIRAQLNANPAYLLEEDEDNDDLDSLLK